MNNLERQQNQNDDPLPTLGPLFSRMGLLGTCGAISLGYGLIAASVTGEINIATGVFIILGGIFIAARALQPRPKE